MVCSDVSICNIPSFLRIQDTCKALTIVFHLMLTAMFSWLCAQSLHLLNTLRDIMNVTFRRRMTSYHVLGYGYPCVIMLLALSIFFNSYGTTTHRLVLDVSLFLFPYNDKSTLLVHTFVGIILNYYYSQYFAGYTFVNVQKNHEFSKDLQQNI